MHIHAIKTHRVRQCDSAGKVYARIPGHLVGHLSPTPTIELPLEYFISKPIKKGFGKTVCYILLIMAMMYMICYVCL